MEISALTGSFPMAMPLEARAARTANTAVERGTTASTDNDTVTGDRAARARAQDASVARDPLTTRATQDDTAAREAREAREALVKATAGGGFQFEMEGKIRVMKVLDSKDVLIYQVPPKGKLEIIQSQDQTPPPQVSTRV